MNRLKEIISKCKGSVSLDIDGHKDCYQTIPEYMGEFTTNETPEEQAGSEIYAEILKRGTVIRMQFYPRTPVSFFALWHYDLDAILDQAIECLNQDGVCD